MSQGGAADFNNNWSVPKNTNFIIILFVLSWHSYRQTQPEPSYCGLTTLVIVLNGELRETQTPPFHSLKAIVTHFVRSFLVRPKLLLWTRAGHGKDPGDGTIILYE